MAIREYKATAPIELSDMSTERRTAVFAHAAYDSVDKKKDIARRGMFAKSWKESKAIDFLVDHDDGQKPGLVIDLFDDERKAYTKVKFSESTLGKDTMIMMDEGIIKGASFGFYTMKSNQIEVKGKKARELKEVLQFESTVTYKLSPINDLAGVVKVTKAMLNNFEIETKALSSDEQRTLLAIVKNDQATLESLVQLSGAISVTDDLYSWISWNISRRADIMGDIRSQLRYNAASLGELKAHQDKLEKFCRDTTASDDCIQTILGQVEEVKGIISAHDTSNTRQRNEPSDSVSKEFTDALHLLTLKI